MIPSFKVSFLNKYSLATVLFLLFRVALAQVASFDQARRSLVRINTAFGDCHGVLVNTAGEENKQLVLTARHCFDDNFVLVRFIFGGLDWLPGANIESSSWNTRRFRLLAESKDQDYALFELPEPIPEQFFPYAAGWNSNASRPLNSYGFSVIGDSLVHFEDIDRPSVLTNDAIVDIGGTPVKNGAWWIKSWERGFTMVGSSGAPLFDQWSRVVGILSAGASTPEAPFNDFFSRLDLIFSDEFIRDNLNPNGDAIENVQGQELYARSKISNYTDQSFVYGDIAALEISEHFDLSSTTVYGVYIPISAIDEFDQLTIRILQNGTVLREQTTEPYSIFNQVENYVALTEPLTLAGPIDILINSSGTTSFKLLAGPTSITTESITLEDRSIGVGLLADTQEVITSPTTFSVYPNPARNNLYVEGADINDEFHFLDTKGNEVFPRVTTDYRGRRVYNVDSFTDGIYLLTLPSDEVIRLFIDN